MPASPHPDLDAEPRGSVVRTISLMITAALLVALLPAAPASAFTCAEHRENHEHPAHDGSHQYFMGAHQTKANLDCNDVNVSWSNHSSSFRGQYWSGSHWVWNSSGRVWINSGDVSPWAVIMGNVLPGTAVRVGSWEEHQWWNWKRSDWQI